MVKKISKKEAVEKIEKFFSEENFKSKSSKEIKKIKRFAMKHNIPLREKRKLFCKNCLRPFFKSSIRIKNDFLTITCEYCKEENKWRIR
ncbi:MAG: hypothetical protein PVJ67_03385 [Candidatus Pacearchaeota archaeon]|jgi:RNase P subunit RPR2